MKVTKVTGYQLRETIRKWTLRRDTAAGQFSDSLEKFKDEIKTDPRELVKIFLQAETAISILQTAQARYNLQTEVEVQGKVWTLAEAVKLVGGAGRIEKMWRSVAKGGAKNRYSYSEDVRRDGEEHRVATITPDEALELATTAARYAGDLRSAIAAANATEVDLVVQGSLLD